MKKMKKYPCFLADSNSYPPCSIVCEYGGNKSYNYGFCSGMASYCRLIKKWVGDFEKCPKTTDEKL